MEMTTLESGNLMMKLIKLKKDLQVLAGQSVSTKNEKESNLTFSFEVSMALIEECELLVKQANTKEIGVLLKYKDQLKQKQISVKKILHFKSPFDSLCKFISSFQQAQSKPNGTLVLFWRNSNRISYNIVKTIKAVSETQEDAHTKNAIAEKLILWKKLGDIFFKCQMQYLKYVDQLKLFHKGIDEKTNSQRYRLIDLTEMKRYLNGETEQLTEDVDEEKHFLADVFGAENRNNQLLLKILRESLITVAKSHDFDVKHFDQYQRHIQSYIVELENLKAILEGLIEHINVSESMMLTKKLVKIYEHDLELQRAKEVIHRVYSQ